MERYVVTLTVEERQGLFDLIAAGKAAAQKLAHARILLKADASGSGPAWPDLRIAEAVEVSVATIERVRQRFVEARSRSYRDSVGPGTFAAVSATAPAMSGPPLPLNAYGQAAPKSRTKRRARSGSWHSARTTWHSEFQVVVRIDEADVSDHLDAFRRAEHQ